MIDMYRRADLICVPTYYREGFPTALLEAASVGRPIVICDNIGGREFLRNGIDALVVPPRSPTELADAIETLIRDPDQGARISESAHNRFLDGYTKQVMVDRTLEAVRTLGFPVPVGPLSSSV